MKRIQAQYRETDIRRCPAVGLFLNGKETRNAAWRTARRPQRSHFDRWELRQPKAGCAGHHAKVRLTEVLQVVALEINELKLCSDGFGIRLPRQAPICPSLIDSRRD
jgi:hypothetical protein